MSEPEAWLRGPVADVPPPLQPVAHALVQARQDIEGAVDGLQPHQLWQRPGGAASAGFHLLHLAGSLDRLLTYARGEMLSGSQREALQREAAVDPGLSRDDVLQLVQRQLDDAMAQVRRTPAETLDDTRAVGRAGLPSTVRGLLFHAAEHTTRHAGQFLTTLRVLRGMGAGEPSQRCERPLPTEMIASVVWRGLQEPLLDHCRFARVGDDHVLNGTVLCLLDGRAAQVQYIVFCGPDWRTRIAHVAVVRGNDVQSIEIRRDDDGRWWKGAEALPAFDGIDDVDLEFTPATNTLPLRRRRPGVDEALDVDAVWIRLDGLHLERLAQRYRRTGDARYRYEAVSTGFAADVDVGDNDIVARYGDLWERIDNGTGGAG